jgi:hypothetical protein
MNSHLPDITGLPELRVDLLKPKFNLSQLQAKTMRARKKEGIHLGRGRHIKGPWLEKVVVEREFAPIGGYSAAGKLGQRGAALDAQTASTPRNTAFGMTAKLSRFPTRPLRSQPGNYLRPASPRS